MFTSWPYQFKTLGIPQQVICFCCCAKPLKIPCQHSVSLNKSNKLPSGRPSSQEPQLKDLRHCAKHTHTHTQITHPLSLDAQAESLKSGLVSLKAMNNKGLIKSRMDSGSRETVWKREDSFHPTLFLCDTIHVLAASVFWSWWLLIQA